MNTQLRFKRLFLLCSIFCVGINTYTMPPRKTNQTDNNLTVPLLRSSSLEYDSITSTSSNSDEDIDRGKPGFRRTNSDPLPEAIKYPILPTQEQRPDITNLMRKAYEGDWIFFKKSMDEEETNLRKFRQFFANRSLKNHILQQDKYGNTLLHYFAKSPNLASKPQMAEWIFNYIKKHIHHPEEKKLLTKLVRWKNKAGKSMNRILLDKFKSYDPAKPTTESYPYTHYVLFYHDMIDQNVFNDVLAWSVARNSQSEVKNLIAWRTPYGDYDPRRLTHDKKHPTEYARNDAMLNLLKEQNRKYLAHQKARQIAQKRAKQKLSAKALAQK